MRLCCALLVLLTMATSTSAMTVLEYLSLRDKLGGKTVLVTGGKVACMTNETLCYIFDDTGSDIHSHNFIMFSPSRLPEAQKQLAIRCAGECNLDVIGVVGADQYALTRLVATGVARPNDHSQRVR